MARSRSDLTAPGAEGRLPTTLLDDALRAEAAERIRLEQILDAMTVGYLAMDIDWRITYVNARAVDALGLPHEQLLGGVIWDLFPAIVGTDLEMGYRRAAETGEPFTFDTNRPAPLNAWYDVQAVAENGGVALYFLDITARKNAQHAAEEAVARLHLLASVTAQLTETLDAEQAVARLAQLVVPALADWCIITLVDDDTAASTPSSARASRAVDLRRGLRDVGWWHRDAAARPLVEGYATRRLEELSDTSFLLQALRAGRPVLVSDSTTAITAVLDPEGQALPLLAELAPRSSAIFPLRGRGRSVGLMSLFNGAGRAPVSDQEVETAEEVAARAGLALDSARLYRQQRDLAEGLQRSLLSAPPEPDHGQVVVRYLPAIEAAQVGGDWYDAFMQPDGATVLVIGDVVGHDTEAAAAMSQVRTMMRAFGGLGDDPPAEILTKTDRVMANLEVSTTATAIVARIEQTLDERARGVTRLRWSDAGHPPAMVIHTDARVQVLAAADPDLLLGVDPETERRESVVVLDRGATVLLYTDGLVERRDQSLQEGLHLLEETLRDLAGQDLSLDDLLDALLRRMMPAHPEDDVAIIAIRLHRQDRPRPAEAGPQRVPAHVPPEPAIAPAG
ncbi:MAG: SpoIIE family protein phosphatase [Janthinobacterium lividum]